MTALESVRAALVADSGVTDALAQAIYPLQAPQGQAVPYAILDTTHTHTFNALGGFAGLDLCQVALEVWSGSFTDAAAIALTCRRALEAAGFLCVDQVPDLVDDDVSPNEFRSGWVFQASQ